jgi:hypothetical protein
MRPDPPLDYGFDISMILDVSGLAGTVGWCPGPESNQRHCDFQSHALPTELPGQFAYAGNRQDAKTASYRWWLGRLSSSHSRLRHRGRERRSQLSSSRSAGGLEPGAKVPSSVSELSSVASRLVPAITYPPPSQRDRSMSAQRFEQNGRYSGTVGLRHVGQRAALVDTGTLSMRVRLGQSRSASAARIQLK